MSSTPAIRIRKRLTPTGPVLILSQGEAGPIAVDEVQARQLVLLLLKFYGATKQ